MSLHLHWFKPKWNTIVHSYDECRCGRRRIRRQRTIGYQPLALWWLDGLDEPPSKPPKYARLRVTTGYGVSNPAQ